MEPQNREGGEKTNRRQNNRNGLVLTADQNRLKKEKEQNQELVDYKE